MLKEIVPGVWVAVLFNTTTTTNSNKIFQQQKVPPSTLCPRCRKGNHWAAQCHSRFDIDGNPLQSLNKQGNGTRGQPQAPLNNGAFLNSQPPVSGQMGAFPVQSIQPPPQFPLQQFVPRVLTAQPQHESQYNACPLPPQAQQQ